LRKEKNAPVIEPTTFKEKGVKTTCIHQSVSDNSARKGYRIEVTWISGQLKSGGTQNQSCKNPFEKKCPGSREKEIEIRKTRPALNQLRAATL